MKTRRFFPVGMLSRLTAGFMFAGGLMNIVQAQTLTPLYQWTFNGVSGTGTPSYSAGGGTLISGGTGSFTNVGVSGAAGDFCYKATDSAGIATNNADISGLGTLNQMTVTFWMKPSVAYTNQPQSFARLLMLGNSFGYDESQSAGPGFTMALNGYTNYQVNVNNGLEPTTGGILAPYASNQWVFVVMEYDGTSGNGYFSGPMGTAIGNSSANCALFLATTNSANVGAPTMVNIPLPSFSGSPGPITNTPTMTLFVGNRANLQRGFQGSIDNINIFTNLLTTNQLLAVRNSSLPQLVAGTPAVSVTNPVPQGTTIVLSEAASGGTPPYTYQWQTDGGSGGALTNIPGATFANFTNNTAGLPLGNVKYDVVVNDSIPITVTSAPVTVNVTNTPLLVGASTASAFTTTYGTASAAQTFPVTGYNLTANITATAPTGFEVSINGATYGGTATFVQSGGSASGTLYVRLAATAAVSGSYDSKNLALTSSGASTINIGTASSGNAVSPAALTITVRPQTITYGTIVPAGTVTYSGFVNGETNTVLTTQPVIVSVRSGVVAAGSYANNYTASGAAAVNYDISYNNLTGTLTVNPATISVGAISTNNPCGYKDAVAFRATLPSDATGNVVFSSTNGPISTNSVSLGAALSASITNLLRGTNAITVSYSGDNNYLASTTVLAQMVTNHPPVLLPLDLTRTAGLSLHFNWSQLTNQWSDVDGDSVTLDSFNLVSTNGVTLLTNSTVVVYPATAPNISDQISYTAIDSYGTTVSGDINIAISNSVVGTNSIVSIVAGNPAMLTAYGVIGYSYVTERSTNLADWASISTNVVGTNGVISVTDNFSDLGGIPPVSACYRIKWHP